MDSTSSGGSAGASPDPDPERLADAAEALSKIANEERIRIIKALEEADADASLADIAYGPPFEDFEGRSTDYTALKDRIEMRDNGRFNYHVGQLTGTFVEKSEGTYRLTWDGILAYNVVVSLFEDDPASRTFETDATCHACDAPLTATYTENQRFRLRCGSCSIRYAEVQVSRRGNAALDREGLLTAAATKLRTQAQLARNGICGACSGPLDFGVTLPPERDDPESVPQPMVTGRCPACNAPHLLTVGESLLTRPAVIRFLDDHRVDVHRTPPWELPLAADGDAVTVRSRDPVRVAVTAERDGDRLTVVVDGDAETVEVTRER